MPDTGLGISPVYPENLLEASLDEPVPGSLIMGTVTVAGWAFSPSGIISRVEVWLDETRLGQIKYGLPRPDVAQSFKGIAPLNCGYRGLLDFNAEAIGEGEKKLRVLISDQSGQQRELSLIVQVQTPGNPTSPEAYRHWQRQHTIDKATLVGQRADFTQLSQPPRFRLQIRLKPETLLFHLQATLSSLQSQTYQGWELYPAPPDPEKWADFAREDERIRTGDEPENDFDWLIWLEAGDQLAPQALFRLYEWLEQHPEAAAVYPDEDWRNETGEFVQPFFKPDWSPEYLRHTNYVGAGLVVRREIMAEVNLATGPELALELAELPDLVVGHIPEVLIHRVGSPLSEGEEQEGQVTQIGAVSDENNRASPRRYYPTLSLLFQPGSLEVAQLEKYLTEFFDRVRYPNLELLLVGENKPVVHQRDWPMPVRFLRFSHQAGLAARFNEAVAHAEGDYLLFLDKASPVLSEDWAENLLYYAEQSQVGAVGGLVLTENQTVAEAGLRLNPQEGLLPLSRGYPAGSSGYHQSLKVAHEVSALSLQGLLLKKALFKQVGGFNPLFESVYVGPDLCLRLRQADFQLIFTPDAVLKQADVNWLDDGDLMLEKMLFMDIWQDWLEQYDSFYNPNFNQNYSDYRI